MIAVLSTLVFQLTVLIEPISSTPVREGQWGPWRVVLPTRAEYLKIQSSLPVGTGSCRPYRLRCYRQRTEPCPLHKNRDYSYYNWKPNGCTELRSCMVRICKLNDPSNLAQGNRSSNQKETFLPRRLVVPLQPQIQGPQNRGAHVNIDTGWSHGIWFCFVVITVLLGIIYLGCWSIHRCRRENVIILDEQDLSNSKPLWFINKILGTSNSTFYFAYFEKLYFHCWFLSIKNEIMKSCRCFPVRRIWRRYHYLCWHRHKCWYIGLILQWHFSMSVKCRIYFYGYFCMGDKLTYRQHSHWWPCTTYAIM